MQYRLHGKQVCLLVRQSTESLHHDRRATGREQHRRDDNNGDSHQRHQLGKVGKHGRPEAGRQGVGKHADTGNHDAHLERQGREY